MSNWRKTTLHEHRSKTYAYIMTRHSPVLMLMLMASLSHWSLVVSYSSGAPNLEDACIHMSPSGHDADPQDTPAPFHISLSHDYYEPNKEIEVTISRNGSQSFKGFIIQARQAFPDHDTEPETAFGRFTPDDGGLSKHSCESFQAEGSSLTHTSSSEKDSLMFTWTAPPGYVGHLQFIATVVQIRVEYWMGIESAIVVDPTAGTFPPDVTSVTEEPPHPMPTGTVPDIDLSGCGVTKGCYRDPESCEQMDCSYLLTWQSLTPDTVHFEISVKLKDNADWAAVGLSYDTKMGDDSVVDCLHDIDTSAVNVQMSYNYNDGGSHYNLPLNDKSLGLVPGSLEGYCAGGYIMCRFTRLVSVNDTAANDIFSDDGKVFDLDHNYYLFLGRGPVSGGSKSKHVTVPIVSPQKVNTASESYIDLGGVINYPLIQAHGSLMVFAWMVLVSVGVLMPRYFKPAWPTHELFKKAIWFQIHRTCMSLAVLTCIAAFILIFVEVGGYAYYDDLPEAVHPPLGICVTLLACLNPCLAFFRCHPGNKYRPIFNWTHFTVGECAHIGAAANIFIACYMAKARLPDYTIWVMTAFVCWHVAIETTLAVHSYWLKRQGGSAQAGWGDLYDDIVDDTPSIAGSTEKAIDDADVKVTPPPGSKFKTTMVLVHFAGVLGLGIYMIVLICTV